MRNQWLGTDMRKRAREGGEKLGGAEGLLRGTEVCKELLRGRKKKIKREQ